MSWFDRFFRHPPEPVEPTPLMPPDEAEAVLVKTLDALGMARHRPFSR